jgi:hypothetical protein
MHLARHLIAKLVICVVFVLASQAHAALWIAATIRVKYHDTEGVTTNFLVSTGYGL